MKTNRSEANIKHQVNGRRPPQNISITSYSCGVYASAPIAYNKFGNRPFVCCMHTIIYYWTLSSKQIAHPKRFTTVDRDEYI